MLEWRQVDSPQQPFNWKKLLKTKVSGNCPKGIQQTETFIQENLNLTKISLATELKHTPSPANSIL